MQRYNIFSKYHSVLITNQSLSELNIQNKNVILCNRENFNSLSLSEILEQKQDNRSVILQVKDLTTEMVFRECTNTHTFVLAAGGLVSMREKYLFIYRNGFWDLPKGHWEQGESIEQTALREVKEECGLNDLVLGIKIGETYHTYFMNGRWEVKQTHWYNMTSKTQTLVPQTEEGITKAVWIDKKHINEVIEKCYPSLKDLLQQVKLF